MYWYYRLIIGLAVAAALCVYYGWRVLRFGYAANKIELLTSCGALLLGISILYFLA